MQQGIVALRDVTRVLRSDGAARKGGDEQERGAMFDLTGLCDRLAAFADDQGVDDWHDFWITILDVETLRRHLAALAGTRGLGQATLPALRGLADELEILAQRVH